jgi:hypothetical protein
MLRLTLLQAALIASVVSFSASYGYADEFSARLNGFQRTRRAEQPDRRGPV